MDRRRHNRIYALFDGEDQVMVEGQTQSIYATILNLSAAGTLLMLSKSEPHFSVGDNLDLFFDNGGQRLEFEATVIRSEGKQIAFEFSDLSPDAKMAIDTKLIRMAIISGQIHALDANEVPEESESWWSDSGCGVQAITSQVPCEIGDLVAEVCS